MCRFHSKRYSPRCGNYLFVVYHIPPQKLSNHIEYSTSEKFYYLPWSYLSSSTNRRAAWRIRDAIWYSLPWSLLLFPILSPPSKFQNRCDQGHLLPWRSLDEGPGKWRWTDDLQIIFCKYRHHALTDHADLFRICPMVMIGWVNSILGPLYLITWRILCRISSS